VRNNEAIHIVKEDRNILHTLKSKKTKWIGHVLRINCLVKHVTEDKIEERIKMAREKS
jgi:hypothetical protein